MASKLICPLMTARVTVIDDPTNKSPKITPQTVMCQEEQCALWDKQHKACCLLSMVIELIKVGETNE